METFPIPETAAADTTIDNIHWKQLWSLAALYGSIIIGWIAYENYQPRLLVQFHFTDFAFLLMAAQGVILVVTPLIAGRLGDRYRLGKGHRLPIISSGISFAAMVFMTVAFTLLSEPGDILRWILPVLIVLWLTAMSIFTSPALSTVELFTPVDKLPHAMAILTITSNLIYAMEPVIVDIIDYVGAPITFIAGGVTVFLSGYALRKHSLRLFSQTDDREAPGRVGTGIRRSAYAAIFLMGCALGVATMVMFSFFPGALEDKLGRLFDTDGSMFVFAMLLLSALLSWPITAVVNRWGIGRTFGVAIAVTLFSAAAIGVSSMAALVIAMSIIYAIGFTALSVSSLPLALARSAQPHKVFCVGVFFSGVALPEGFWEAWLAR